MYIVQESRKNARACETRLYYGRILSGGLSMKTLRAWCMGLKFIYANVYFDRNRNALILLITFAFLIWIHSSALALLSETLPFGLKIYVIALGFVMWFVALPCIFYMIDYKNRPERIRKLGSYLS